MKYATGVRKKPTVSLWTMSDTLPKMSAIKAARRNALKTLYESKPTPASPIINDPPEKFSYQGLTVVVSGKKLNSRQIEAIVPHINAHHDGLMSHGELITRIHKLTGVESDWDSTPR